MNENSDFISSFSESPSFLFVSGNSEKQSNSKRAEAVFKRPRWEKITFSIRRRWHFPLEPQHESTTVSCSAWRTNAAVNAALIQQQKKKKVYTASAFVLWLSAAQQTNVWLIQTHKHKPTSPPTAAAAPQRWTWTCQISSEKIQIFLLFLQKALSDEQTLLLAQKILWVFPESLKVQDFLPQW